MITITDADSDSNVPPSKWADNTKVDSNSMPAHPCQGEHAKPVFRPMRRGTKRSIDLDEAADGGIGEQDGGVDEQVHTDVDVDDSDAEICMWVPGEGMGTLRKTSRPRVDVHAHSMMERLRIVKTTLCERKMRYPSLHQREPSLQSTSLGLPPLP
ncbi:hypothetical protein EDD15DRAFT_1016422 [Pisolithus albus]|nr:hypothetical protein EDD15DRAFT_1016422 [Pisolithus albus]